MQSKSVNNVCKLFELLGDIIPRPVTGDSPLDLEPMGYSPQVKIPSPPLSSSSYNHLLLDTASTLYKLFVCRLPEQSTYCLLGSGNLYITNMTKPRSLHVQIQLWGALQCSMT